MKLRAKLIVALVPLAAASVGVMTDLSLRAVRSHIISEARERGIRHGAELLVRPDIQTALTSSDEARLLPALHLIQRRMGAGKVALLSNDGIVLAHTNVAEVGRRPDAAWFSAALSRNEAASREILDEGQPQLEQALPLFLNNAQDPNSFVFGERTRGGVVVFAVPLTDDYRIAREISRKVFAVIAGVAVIWILAMYWVVRRLLSPVKLLSEATHRIARGELDVRVGFSSGDELGDLASRFNEMSESLARTTVSKEYVDAILENMLDGVFVTDLGGRVTRVNAAACRLMRKPASLLVGQDLLALFAFPEGSELVSGFPAGRGVENHEGAVRGCGGAGAAVLFSHSALRDASGSVVGGLAVARDITARKDLEAKLARSEKLSAVGQLAAGVAHEINNPLGVILGFAQSAVRRVPGGDMLELPLRSIEREAIRCKTLVQELLTFSRSHKAAREAVDVNLAVEGALSLVETQAKTRGVTLEKRLAADLPPALANGNQLQQVVINLSSNAIDAMPQGGMLFVSTRRGDSDDVLVEVRDTGTGIPPEVLPRIFEPFFTTKEVGKGTGLGLPLVHEIVTRHGGTLDVKSVPGDTRFTVRLPASRLAAAAPPPADFSGERRP